MSKRTQQNTIEFENLYCGKGNHDKVYELAFYRTGGNYVVEAHHGRRGSVLRSIIKHRGTNEAEALREYDKILNDKLKEYDRVVSLADRPLDRDRIPPFRHVPVAEKMKPKRKPKAPKEDKAARNITLGEL